MALYERSFLLTSLKGDEREDEDGGEDVGLGEVGTARSCGKRFGLIVNNGVGVVVAVTFGVGVELLIGN
ncbi:MAG: hypothetical protein A2V81_00170 [Candidatus Abawacabacteria bacterium RBG_16_42_10]|uniref:Uncharacterized protein n=1 Tax=Candidatus Abawacabacteria bacterium RBG_16_42_10 TaxID=1817814 RepID=A0A1F4XLD1_9BACT|nr:MAG: hypothetical protein A2V81_00170 [Candidatus Abawacabacteria bacterium RBG_16_42_10]